MATQAPAAAQLQPGQHWYEPAWRITLPGLEGLDIALDAQGHVRVPYHTARSSLLRISAADLLGGRWPAGLAPDALQGAWVIIGASAFGLADIVPIALGEAVSGSEVHMQLLLGMIDGRIPYTPQGQGGLLALITCLALGSLLALSARSRPPSFGVLPVASSALILGLLGLQAWAQLARRWMLDTLSPAALIALSAALLTLGEQAPHPTRKAAHLHQPRQLRPPPRGREKSPCSPHRCHPGPPLRTHRADR